MGNSIRKFTLRLWYRAEKSKVDNASEDTPDQSSGRQTLEHTSYGGSLSIGIESQSHHTSTIPGRISNEENNDGPSRVQKLSGGERCESQTLPAIDSSKINCKGKNNVQQPSPKDEADSTTVQETTAGNNDSSPNRNNSSPKEEERNDSSISISNESDTDNWNKIIESMIPDGDWKGTKAFILNTEEDNKIADELAENLRIKFSCKIPRDIFNSLYMVYGGQVLTEAQKWADILLVMVTPSWVRTVKNIQPTYETGSELTKYHYVTLQKTFLTDSGVNFKVIPVVISETDKRLVSDIAEVRCPFTIDCITDNFQSITTQFLKSSREAKKLILNSSQTSSSDNQTLDAATGEEKPACN